MSEPGLRERKKQRMYETVSEIAIGLFLEKGYDAVSVAEIAAAAEISKPTLFRYFPSKEDLVFRRIADHEDEAARVVWERGVGVAPLDALRLHFVDGIERDDPITGVNGHPAVRAFYALLYGTPALVGRLHTHLERSEAALAEALGGDLDARLAAGQIVAVRRVLAEENWRRVMEGEDAEVVRADAVVAAERGFGMLAGGLTRFAQAS
ncbi:TetR family transcriptional regulator [Streptomyces sp. NPDC046909]|uniref:TetR/AcrR family transcriptional regulator n=1 Tax=Streptomyces sp. NPDC046909 TaxID=3155617 RepID=UPI0033C992CF